MWWLKRLAAKLTWQEYKEEIFFGSFLVSFFCVENSMIFGLFLEQIMII